MRVERDIESSRQKTPWFSSQKTPLIRFMVISLSFYFPAFSQIRCRTVPFLCSRYAPAIFVFTGWFTLKPQILFPGECPRRFLYSNHEILHTSSICSSEDPTFFFVVFVRWYISEKVDYLSPNSFGENPSEKTRRSALEIGM